MKSLSIWAFAAAVLLTGCANEEITEQHDIQGENGRKAITVSTYLPGHTRGYNATQADINSLTQELEEGFLMTAVTDDSVIIDAAHYFVNVDTVPNICFTDDGSTYTWPDEESELKFMAHYPPSAEICQLNVKDRILTASPGGETDVMVADAAFTANSDEGHVQLTFKHLLAHAVFNVNNSEKVPGAKFTLQQISFEAPKTLEYAFGKGTTKVSEEWNPYDLVDGSEGVGLSSEFSTIGSVMVPTADDVKHTIEVEYTVVINNDVEHPRTYKKSVEVELKAGFVNVLNITLASDKLIMVKSVTDQWNPEVQPQEITFEEMRDLSGEDGAGRSFIDLGLPSRTLWAAWNVGAMDSGNNGAWFAWGETEDKYDFVENYTYRWTPNGDDDPYGAGQGKEVLDLDDDAAYANWEREWCMPDSAQFKELFDERYTTWEYDMVGWKRGIRITSKTFPENSIFLPCSGVNGNVAAETYEGHYWTRNVDESGTTAVSLAFSIDIENESIESMGITSDQERTTYLSVRAVRYSE
jgi:hypothetical protein